MATLPPGSTAGPSQPQSSAAWLVGWCLAAAVLRLFEIAGDGLAPRSAALAGLVVLRLLAAGLGGLLQAWMLRRRLSTLGMSGWVLATAVGSGLALLLVNLLWEATQRSSPGDPLALMLPPAPWIPQPLLIGLAGAIVGAVQLPVLRRHLAGAAAWPAISALAALVGEGAAVLIRSPLGRAGLPVQPSFANPVHWWITAIAAALAALITGGFLLLRRPARPPLGA